MKASFVFLAVLGLASAQKKEDFFPKCSIDCLNDGTKKATSCNLTDAVCWCVQSNYEAIYNSAVSCVMAACGAAVSVDKVLPAAIEFCSAASASASATATATAGSSSASTSVSASETSSPSSAATTTTSAGTSGSNPTSTSASARASETGAAAAIGAGSIPVMVAAGLVALL